MRLARSLLRWIVDAFVGLGWFAGTALFAAIAFGLVLGSTVLVKVIFPSIPGYGVLIVLLVALLVVTYLAVWLGWRFLSRRFDT